MVGDKGIVGSDGDKGPTGMSGDAGPAGSIGDAGVQVRHCKEASFGCLCVHVVCVHS